MTRMRLFFIDKNGTCYRSTEFNGNGYCHHPQDNGWIGLERLIKFVPTDDVEDVGFTDMIMMFNEATFDYPSDEVSYIYKTANIDGNELLDIIKNSYTDYIYIRNDASPLQTEAGEIKSGITVFEFGHLYDSPKIQECIEKAKGA